MAEQERRRIRDRSVLPCQQHRYAPTARHDSTSCSILFCTLSIALSCLLSSFVQRRFASGDWRGGWAEHPSCGRRRVCTSYSSAVCLCFTGRVHMAATTRCHTRRTSFASVPQQCLQSAMLCGSRSFQDSCKPSHFSERRRTVMLP